MKKDIKQYDLDKFTDIYGSIRETINFCITNDVECYIIFNDIRIDINKRSYDKDLLRIYDLKCELRRINNK